MVLLASFLLAACGGDGVQTVTGPGGGGSLQITQVRVTPHQVTVREDSTRELRLEVTASDGSSLDRPGDWRVDGPSVVDLMGSGATRQVKGMEPGSTRVIATVDGMADTADVQVEAAQHRVASVALSPASIDLAAGETGEVTVEVTAEDGSTLDRPASWQVGDSSIAELSGSGATRQVEGLAAGSTVVIAKVSGVTDTAQVAVSASDDGPTVASVTLSPSSLDLVEGGSDTLSLAVTAEDGSTLDRAGTWQVADASVADLAGSGAEREVQALAAGTTSVVATVDGVSDTAQVDVTAADDGPTVASVTLSPASLDLVEGGSDTLSLAVTAEDGSTLDRAGTWQMVDASVADLAGSGAEREVQALAAGTTSVVATVDGVSDTAQVDVTAAATAPAMPSSVSVAEDSRTDSTVRYTAQWSSSDGADSYDWAAGSNNGHWSDSGSGLTSLQSAFTAPRSDADDGSFFCVEAVNSAGTSEQRCDGFTVPAKTTSSSGGSSGGTTTDTTVASVTISPSSATVQAGSSVQLTATATNASGDTISALFSWSSTNSSVATVDAASGKVTGQSQGTVGIVATADNGVADTATVDVTSSTTGSSGPAVVFNPDLESSTTSLRNDSQGVFSENEDLGSSRFFLDSSVGYPGGSRSMRYDWVDQGAGNAVSIGRKIPIGQQKEVWVEAYVRWSKNFMDNIQLDSNDGDPSTDVAAHKFLFLAATCVTSCNAGWEISDGTKVYRWALLWPAATRNPPHGPISAETPAIVETSVATAGPQIIKGISHDVSQHFDGRWHRMRIHVRHDPGAYEVWIDGQKVVDLVQEGFDFTVRPEVATTAVLLGRNKDDGNPSGTESLWWGKVSIWTSDPGWP